MSQASSSSWVKPPMDKSTQERERAERAEQREFQKLRDKLDRLEAWEASQTGLGRQEEVVYVGQTEEAQQQQQSLHCPLEGNRGNEEAQQQQQS